MVGEAVLCAVTDTNLMTVLGTLNVMELRRARPNHTGIQMLHIIALVS